ncbi:MAG: ABC transporter permease [Candidatus Thermoplasmatota archaeon]
MSADAIADTGRFLSTRARPKPTSTLGAVGTLAWRAMLKIKHVPFQLFDVTVMPIMFTLLFTSMFSGALEAAVGGDYIRYLLPGILVQTIIFITVYTGVGLNSDIHKGLFDRFRSLPMWQPAPIFGALAGDLFRYSVASIVVLIVGLLIGFRGDPIGIVLAFLCVLLFAFSVSWIWIIIGMKVKTPESVMTTSFIFLMPLTFASNIFVPTESLKWEWLRAVVANNPVTHLAGATRSFMIGTPMDDHLWWVLGSSAVLLAVFAPLALLMYRKER